ncbi:P-loop containing nucleoside triphosphate hydrolase protein [Globomyces pollinis-pini]|nr:P-loop containing nucleoside triphosphate hydrolase protein [Globomyces pollinis-pini]
MDSTQEMVFQIVKPIIQKCLTGYNGCIFAYGQTGSGKTFAMEGLQGNQRGVIPRVAEQLMLYIENNSRRDNLEGIDFSVRCSYLEIYQESLRDLLLEKKYQGDLKIRMDPNSITGKELYVEGLTETSIKTSSDLLRLIQNGTKNRTTGETNMNKVSSRSHAVFTLIIEQTERKLVIADSIDNLPTVTKKRSKIHLIDLAGSERADSTGATGIRLKEGSAINVSLSCLGNVINALSTSNTYVPYRDSKLTYLLSDSLGGNSLTLVLACLTPLASVYEETIATLRFAERAKKVKNKPTINVDPATLR